MRTAVQCILSGVLLAGCAREQMDDCFTGMGPWELEDRHMAAIHTIELEDRIDLEITVDSTLDDTRLIVEAGRNVLPNVETEWLDGVLHIRNTMRCHWVRDMKRRPVVRVATGSLEGLVYRAVGDVRVKGPITGSTFRLEQWAGHGTVHLPLQVDTCWIGLHTGVGDAVVTGRVHTAHFYTSNFAHIDARALDAVKVLVNNSGTGDIRCRAREEAYLQIRDVGDIHLGGSPPVLDLLRTGTGSLFQGD